MEVGSGYFSNSSSSSSFDSLNGLKLGKKGYFVDAGGLSSPAVLGRPPPALAKKGKKGRVVQGGQPAPVRCQVEGCQVGLHSGKAYYSRHKVCGIHSKSAKVIVAGFEQRFCQQCSRFHLLTEFDQGKRSCRRRLAWHNKRRRKPPPGSPFSHDGGLSSHLSDERSSKTGSFMLDFSAHTQPVLTVRDSRPNARASTSELAFSNQETDMGKFSPHLWNRSPNETSSEIQIQGSTAMTNYFGSDIISSRECLTGVSDCSRALSLLSTQPWESRDQSSSLEINGVVDANVTTPMVQPSGSQSESTYAFSNTLSTEPGLIQSLQPAGNHYHGDHDAAQQNGSRYPGLEHLMGFDYSLPEHSRGYDSFLPNVVL